VFSEPREKANVVAELPAGSETQRVDELPDWVKVRTDSGTEGWVKQGSVFALRR
jgi:SH3-like domain-containing protein